MQSRLQHVPHASLVLGRAEVEGLRADIWMGGAHSEVGSALDEAVLGMSLVIDCAGDMPAALRAAAAYWVACVFADLDAPPMHYDRIEASVRTAAESARTDDGAERVVILCTHGMNRSGLLTGLLLRELGLSGEAAVARIAAARPGALSNEAFRRIVLGG